MSVRNTAPVGHTFSPAQRLFGRALRTNLPQSATSLVPFTPPRDTVVRDHIQRKLKQKREYDKHASVPLQDLPPSSYVYAKPPPTSSSKAWIQGKVIGSAGPRSYLIDTGVSQIRRNCIQVQPASLQHTRNPPFHNWAAPPLPDKLTPNSLTAMPPPSPGSQGTSASLSLTPLAVPVTTLAPASSLSPPPSVPTATIVPPTADESHPTVSLPTSSPVATSPTTSQSPSVTSLPSLTKPQTVTRSGRTVRRPARYSD